MAGKRPDLDRTDNMLNSTKAYTTSGMPKFLYHQDGRKIPTANIDEGNLSAIHRVEKRGAHVVVQENTTHAKAGDKYYLTPQ